MEFLDAKKDLYDKLGKLLTSPNYHVMLLRAERVEAALYNVVQLSHRRPRWARWREPMEEAVETVRRLRDGHAISDVARGRMFTTVYNLRRYLYENLLSC